MEDVLTKELILQAIEKLKETPLLNFYSSVCFECGGSFLSYKNTNNFSKCEQHRTDKEVHKIEPLN